MGRGSSLCVCVESVAVLCVTVAWLSYVTLPVV